MTKGCCVYVNEDKNEWGRRLWKKFHMASELYPLNPSEEDKITFKRFVDREISSIGCGECLPHARKYFEENSKSFNEALQSREKLINFFCDFHNIVNCRLGKKIYLYGYEY